MIDILLTIGLPLLAGLVLTLWRAVATQKRFRLESTRDVTLDMIFLAIGSAGGIFNDSKVRTWLGESAIGVLLLLIFIDLVLASVVLYRQRFTPKGVKMTPGQAAINIMLGFVSLTLVAGVIYGGSYHAGRHP